MFLKSLSIKGFKSFADPATLDLEPGVTVVVGPNGSGKSNVVDAVAWVLGAQAPTAVRSQKMDDVIFAGTQSRPALGRAEVSLTIDNGDGLLPIEFSEVTITRILFRSGDSEYSINGVPCRLLDITELLSDSGVGRQQHIIVSQGQIDAVLNARPEERRAIIEEAAGVLKFRKRKERAERRLAATEENLNRLADLVREVRRQLRPLEKQAEAARRHGDLVAELTALRVHLVGRELAALTGRIESGHRQRVDLDGREGELSRTLARLDAEVLDAEAELAALGGSDVADVASRARSLAERLRGQTNVVAERRRRLEGERRSAVDDGVVSSLEDEAHRIAGDLERLAAERDELTPRRAELADLEQAVEEQRQRFESTWGEGVGSSPVEATEARAQVQALEGAARRDEQETNRILEQLTALGQRHDRLVAERSTLEERRVEAESARPAAERRVEELQQSVAAADAAVESGREARRMADDEAARWGARADALRQALDAARSAAGADALAEVDGVAGTLLDLVAVDPGWEDAVEAAAGEALQAVVVDGVERGRHALDALAGADLAGAVLAIGSAGGGAPVAADSIRHRVRALRPDVDPLLDLVLGSVVAVDGGWAAALDRALAHPSDVIVSRNGDRFAPTGWRIGRAGSGATGAALEEAVTESEAAARAATTAAADLETATADRRRQRDALAEAETELREIRSTAESTAAAVERTTAALAGIADDRERLDRQLREIAERLENDRAELAAIQQQLPGLEAVEAEFADRERSMAADRAALEDTLRTVGARRTELEVASASLESRGEVLRNRQGEVEGRLQRLVEDRARARERREQIDRALARIDGIETLLDERRARLDAWIEALRVETEAQSEAAREVSTRLSARRRERQATERELVEVRERRSRLEVTEAEERVRLESLTEALRHELDTEPEAAMAAERPEVPEGASPESRVRELERELKLLGPINPLAVEEFAELTERHRFLDEQLTDVKDAKRELQRLIHEIDAEIVSVFSAAFADVATNFVELFQVLFPGGRGAVRLTDPDNLLDTGVEIEAKPSGKNVKKLSLLSGGERSLTALGFLFAVFKSRPSPFYVMDEVEAALDDMNLHRFLSLVEEFRKEAQLVIVSHQKRTMEAADVLYGVSMQPGGSSKVVSERVSAG